MARSRQVSPSFIRRPTNRKPAPGYCPRWREILCWKSEDRGQKTEDSKQKGKKQDGHGHAHGHETTGSLCATHCRCASLFLVPVCVPVPVPDFPVSLFLVFLSSVLCLLTPVPCLLSPVDCEVFATARKRLHREAARHADSDRLECDGRSVRNRAARARHTDRWRCGGGARRLRLSGAVEARRAHRI